MKKTFLTAALVLALIFAFSTAACADNYEPINAKLNYVNIMVDYNDVVAPDFVYEGRTYIGVRAVADALGYTVSWNEEENLVILESGGEKVYANEDIAKGQSEQTEEISVLKDYVNAIIINGEPVNVSNIVYGGRTYLGLRDLGELLGYDVSWSEQTKTASLTKGLRDLSISIDAENSDLDALATIYYKIYAVNYPYASNQQILESVKSNIIFFEFLDYVAESNGLEYEQPDIEKGYEQYVASYGSTGNYVTELEAYNLTFEEDYIYFSEVTKHNALQPAVADYLFKNLETIKNLKVKAKIDYDESLEQITKDIAVVKHILIPTQKDGIKLSEEEIKNAQSLANDVRSKAVKSVSAFDELLKIYNNDPGMTDEGYTVYENSGFVKEFEQASLKLEKGEISPVTESVYGYHIIKCIDRKTVTPEFEDYFKEVYQNAYNKMLDDEWQEFAKRSNIELTIK